MGDQISQTSYIRKNTLENYFLLSPLLGNISEQLCNYFGILQDNRSIHYQLGGSVNSRYYKNIEKLNTVFANHNVDFTLTTDVYNVISKRYYLKIKQIYLQLMMKLDLSCLIFLELSAYMVRHLSGIQWLREIYQHLQEQ